jgi:hypothetical protein
MSIVSPPDCNTPIFNPSCFETGDSASGNYVEFPIAQGNTINAGVQVNGLLKVASSGIQSTSTTPINIGTNTSFTPTAINIGQAGTNIVASGSNIDLNTTGSGSIDIGTEYIVGSGGNNIYIGRNDGAEDGSTLTLRGLLNLTNGLGSSGQVLTSGGGSGNLSWASGGGGGGTTVQSGETQIGASLGMTSVTGSVTYVSAYASKPNIQLTHNLNGTGTTIIPVAILSHIQFPAGTYTGFNWIAGTTSATGSISWYATI